MKLPLTPGLLAAALAATAVLANSPAPAPEDIEMLPHTNQKQAVEALIPATHIESTRRTVQVDGSSAELIRHERLDGRNAKLGGEHFSLVVASDGLLKGFANIDLDLAGRPLPSRERTEDIARAFLQAHAPDLLPRMQISWIEPHDEPIRVDQASGADTVRLTGMKMKARNLADGRWFWVIVGADEKPMIFERDIVWIDFPGHRKTEKWLHDTWLQERIEAGR